ncbi:MAG: DUF4180 domain-containing protein [Caulobacter sp.]|nr:DUF4180 domain-containing protein [Caulobacter sp.]
MSGQTLTLHGTIVFLCDAEGPVIAGDRDSADLIGDAFGSGATVIALPLARLSPDFLKLSTRVAGEILQKLINYRFRVIILGDVSEAVAGSDALRDFVVESNRGEMVWFLPDLAALEARLVLQAS